MSRNHQIDRGAVEKRQELVGDLLHAVPLGMIGIHAGNGRKMIHHHMPAGRTVLLGTDQLGEPAGLLAPVGIEIVQTGIDGKVVGLVFAAVQYDEHHVALAERAVESPVRARSITSVLARLIAARLMIAAHEHERPLGSEQFDAFVDETAERNRLVVVVVHHVAHIENPIRAFDAGQGEQAGEFGRVTVHVAQSDERTLLGTRIGRTESVPARDDAVAEGYPIGLEVIDPLRAETIVVSRRRPQRVGPDRTERVVSIPKPVLDGIMAGYLPFGRTELDPRKALVGSGEHESHARRRQFLQIGAVAKTVGSGGRNGNSQKKRRQGEDPDFFHRAKD